MTKEDILQVLREVHHPGKGDRDIVELGMVHDIEVTDSKVVVTLGFPKRRDPLTEYLVGSARAALIRHLPSSVESEDEGFPKIRFQSSLTMPPKTTTAKSTIMTSVAASMRMS